MKITLLSTQEYNTITLPEKCAGIYWVHGRNNEGKLIDIVAIEARRAIDTGDANSWFIKSNRRFQIVDKNGQPQPSESLRPLELYSIKSTDGELEFVLYTEPLSDNRKSYTGYELIGKHVSLKIGRDTENNIIFSNRFVSGDHAELTITQTSASVRDLGSANNTYVNGKAINQAKLNTGDVIYIMGMQIVIAGRYLFLNNPDGNVDIHSDDIRQYNAPVEEPVNTDIDADDDYEEVPIDYYYRAPRFKNDVEEFKLKLDAPPANQSDDEMPLIMLIGPSMTMGMAAMATGTFAVTNAIGRGDMAAAIPSIVMSLSMLLGTLLWPLITKTYQRRQKERKEAKRQSAYTNYLEKMREVLSVETARQERILSENSAGIATYEGRILASAPKIWERTPKHSDFLLLYLGRGKIPLKIDLQYSERRFSVDEDNLSEAMYQFGEQKRWLSNVPICLPLFERFVSGVYADKRYIISYATSLILQIVALHSYDEVKLVLIYNESNADELAFTRWLPHTMDNERTVRYIATNSEEAKELSSSLDAIIEYRKSLSDNKLEDETYFVIICLDKELAAKTECVRRILEHKDNLRFSVLSMFERLKDLPKECTAVVEMRGAAMGSLTLIGDVSEPPIQFNTDIKSQINIDRITSVLSNTVLDISGSRFVLPKKFTFLEMLDIGMVEHINLSDNWFVSDPTKSLAAVVGVDRYGEPFKLDLHEHSHGPHGLVAGMTGSGKSEFIISYILSMAVDFHPHEVAFILIDYKGGGMAKSFENIPHTAGIITNLDGNAIKRSLASMRSELHRRERIFRDVSAQHSISNIDIYKYQKLYRDNKVSEPLPHLFIISDEFAELKKEQPEFMTELTSTARVGRSLGVHLILATQKPGGVVDDQIRSNSRFRICLKVQDTGDSQEMLGRPEAAALVDTGRFYLQVGYNEIFEVGQSAWAGAPYYPSAKVIKDRDDAISVINTNGRVIAEANTDRYAMFKDPQKQLDVITGYISNFCEKENIKQWKMWLDPIPSQIYVDELIGKYGDTDRKFILNPVVGEYDDPAHQSQGILRIPITSEGNVIIYGSAGNGKAMLVEAMCYSLISKHTPNEVNIYILDLGAETLTAFTEAPHIGDVILSYETEKINNLFKLMLGRLESRKKILAEFGGDMVQYNAQAEKPEPNLVLVINNYAVFTELFEDKQAEVNFLTREGSKYGIYFVLTCTGVNNVRFSLLQNFKNIYCLQLNNLDDYASVVGKTEGLYPEKIKGRGFFRFDKDNIFEFQTASITTDEVPYKFIRQYAIDVSEKYTDYGAVGVPMLPSKITMKEILPHIQKNAIDRIPIGIEKESLNIAYYDFADSPVTLVLAANQEWQTFTAALSILFADYYDIKTMVLSPTGKSGAKSGSANYQVFSDVDSTVKAIRDVFNLVLTRNNDYKDKIAAMEDAPVVEPVFVIIQSMSLLKSMLERYKPAEDEEKEADDDTPFHRLQLAMWKCEKAYNVHFIVAEGMNTLTPFTVENWYKTHIDGNNGIWVGSGISTQFRLTVSKKPQDFHANIEPDFGYVIDNSEAKLIKLLLDKGAT